MYSAPVATLSTILSHVAFVGLALPTLSPFDTASVSVITDWIDCMYKYVTNKGGIGGGFRQGWGDESER